MNYKKYLKVLSVGMVCSLLIPTSVYAKEIVLDEEGNVISMNESQPFLERDFSFMEDDALAEESGIDEDVWGSYNKNMRACTSAVASSGNSKNYTVNISTVDGKTQSTPYMITFSSGCSTAVSWQRNNKYNLFFREKYGELIAYMPVSMQYPSIGENSLKYVYKNYSSSTVDNRFKTGFTKWGVPLNTATCGYGKMSKNTTFVSGCKNSYDQDSSVGYETYGTTPKTKGEWQNLGYSGAGYELINSMFPPDYPTSTGTVKGYNYDTNFNRSTTSATTYDNGTDATKTAIKKAAIQRLISQENLDNDVAKWTKRLSLKNNASTEAGNFVGTETVSGHNYYTIVVSKAPKEAKYNLALTKMEIIYSGSTIASYTRSPMKETGTLEPPSSNLYGGKTYTLKFTITNNGTFDLNTTYSVDYTVNGTKKTESKEMNIAANKTGTISVNVTVPNENKTFNIIGQINTSKHNLWNVDDKSTISVTTYKDTTAPTVDSASVTTGCSKDSATISVSSTEKPANAYASGYKNTVLTKPDGSTSTSTSNPATFSVTTDGSYKVKSCDKNGNCSGEKAVTVNKIDKGKPTATISGVPSTWTSSDVTVTVSGTDPSHSCGGIAKTWWRINDGSWQSVNATSKAVTLNSTGNHKFDYAVTDKVGNDSPTLTTYIKIDKTAPDFTAMNPSDMVKVGGSTTSVSYNVQKYDNHSGLNSYSTAWNNNAWGGWISHTSGNSNITFTLGANERDKVNTLWLRIKDNAGNVSRSVTRQVLYDVTGPTVTSYSITPYYNNKTTATVQVTAKDNFQDNGYTNVKYIYLSNDSTNWTKYTASNNSISVTWNTRTPDNWYNVYAKAEDSLGNVGAVQKIPYMTDQTKPTGSIQIDNGQNHFPDESTKLNFTYSDNLSGVSKIEIYDINNGTASGNVHTINNPTATSLSWVLKPYTMSDGSIRAQVGMKITDKAGNVTTIKSKEVYISRVTIQDFSLTNVVNPLIYNKNNPFQILKHPNIPAQELLAGGSFSFKSNYVYPLGNVHNSWRVTHVAAIEYHLPNGTKRNYSIAAKKIVFSGTFTGLHEIPFDMPVGTKVYIRINVQLHDSSGAVFTEDWYPNPDGTLIHVGTIKDDIRNILNFNEIK